MPEWYVAILKIVNSSMVFLLLPAAVIFFVRKDKLAFNFALVTIFFFLIGNLSESFIKTIDKDMFVYRYLFWAAIDIAWMAVIANWALKDKVYLWQSIIGQLIVVSAPLLQLFRLLDRHLWDLSYSNYLYQTLLPIINIATLIVCYLPLLLIFRKRKQIQHLSI